MMDDKLQILSKKISELIGVCDELSDQNKNLVYERNKLLESNSVVKNKVRSMIKEIKAIENKS